MSEIVEVKKEEKLTLKQVYKLLEINEIKVLSGFNSKVLAKKFNPRKHTALGERKVLRMWSEIEGFGQSRNMAKSILVCYVDGKIECEKRIKEIKEHGNEKD